MTNLNSNGNKNVGGGNNMNNTQMKGWGTTVASGAVNASNNTASNTQAPGWTNVGGNSQVSTANNGTTTTFTTNSASGANWGTGGANTTIANGNQAFDKSAPAKEAIKKLAGRLLEIVPKLSNEEFNELAKIYDFADIKDEFIQRSGRQDTYLDNNTAAQAINELNAVFLENNQRSADMNSQLQNIANNVNQGQCDPTAIYNFVLNAINAGAIPAMIQQDGSKSHINKVIKMALAFKNGGTQYGMSGANWGGSNNMNNSSGWGSFGTNNNNNGWSSNNNGGGWLSTPTNNNNNNNSTGGWGAATMFNSNNNNGGMNNSWGGNNWNNNTNNGGSTLLWSTGGNNNNSNNGGWMNNNGGGNTWGTNNNWMSTGNSGVASPWANNNNNNNGGNNSPWMNSSSNNAFNNSTPMYMI